MDDRFCGNAKVSVLSVDRFFVCQLTVTLSCGGMEAG